MIDAKLYFGRVEDNDDPDQLSRVKVRLLPEMNDADVDHLPWVRPFMVENMTADSYSHKPLEVGSTVWCLFIDEYFKQGFYIAGTFIDGLFDYGTVKDQIDSIPEIDSQTYPQARFTRYPDGTIIFQNTSSGEVGIYHSTGSYVVIDKEGSLTGYSKKDVKFYNDSASLTLDNAGNIIQNSDGTIQLNGDSDHLVTYSMLEGILNWLWTNLDTRMYIDPLTGVTGTVNPTHLSQAHYVTSNPGHTLPTDMAAMKANKVKSS